jgi:Spy/CpxP family protein refolding chaperone
MNKTKTRLTVALAAAVFLVGSSFAVTSAFAHGHRGEHGWLGHEPLIGIVHRLNLTEAQKTQVAAILKSNEAEAKTIVTGLAAARVQLTKDILSGADVTAACSEVANYELQAAQLRSAIFSQITKLLTPDQQTTLQNMQNELGQHVDAAVNRGFEHLDKWIAKHSQ